MIDSVIHSAITAGIAALKGPLHGGANEQVVRMLTEIGSLDNVDAFVTKVDTNGAIVFSTLLGGGGSDFITGGGGTIGRATAKAFAAAGAEVALLDLLGQSSGLPVVDLIGGAVRRAVATGEDHHARGFPAPRARPASPEVTERPAGPVRAYSSLRARELGSAEGLGLRKEPSR